MAPVGRRPGAGRNVIYLKQTKQEDSCFSRHQLYHILFHVLGLYHEHNRSDRDKYITIYEKNLKRNYYVRIFSWELMQINDESLTSEFRMTNYLRIEKAELSVNFIYWVWQIHTYKPKENSLYCLSYTAFFCRIFHTNWIT